jgi:tetratricopeptide (TPR) repeat protein
MIWICLAGSLWIETAGCQGGHASGGSVEQSPRQDVEVPAALASLVDSNVISDDDGDDSHESAQDHGDGAPCPVVARGELADDELPPAGLVERYIQAAQEQLDGGSPAAAFTCADLASDVAPRLPEPQLLRAQSLTRLHRMEESLVAAALALALAPKDPAVLLAAAETYLAPEGSAASATARANVALELASTAIGIVRARDGSRQSNKRLAADLLTLQARSLNYLGQPVQALAASDSALRAVPGVSAAQYERAAALFDLHRFSDAKRQLMALLRDEPNDASAHDLLGLTLQWLDRAALPSIRLARSISGAPLPSVPLSADAQAHFAKARSLDPEHFFLPQLITEAEFRTQIDLVLKSLPAGRQKLLKGVRFEISDLPLLSDLQSVSPPFPPTILGLFRGDWPAAGEPGSRSPEPAGSVDDRSDVAPDADALGVMPSIVLYRVNLAREARNRQELNAQIRTTVLHELGHFDGLNEDDLRRRGLQ